MPDLVGPLLERRIMGNAALQRDGVEFGQARRFARCRGIAALAVLDHFGGPAQRADLGDPGHIMAIPFDAEFEILVSVEALRIDGEFSHGRCLSKQVASRPSRAPRLLEPAEAVNRLSETRVFWDEVLMAITLQSTVGGFSDEFMRRLPRLEQAMAANGLDPAA